MLIKINPLDTLFFRDGKPFSMGDDNWADSLFPPSPSVTYGAIRTLFLGNTNFALTDKKTLEDATQHLAIKGIYLQIGRQFFLPAPADFAIEKVEQGDPKKAILQPRTAAYAGIVSNKPLPQITFPDFIVDNDKSKGLFSLTDLEDYLQGKPDKIDPKRDYYVSEPKIGIGRDNATFATDEGKLYRVDMKRLSPKITADNKDAYFQFHKYAQIAVELDTEIDHNWLHFTKLGADTKLAHFAVEPNATQSSKIPCPLTPADTQFKLYLATHAIFDQGWLPGCIDPQNNYIGTFGNDKHSVTLQLTGMALGKPQSIGGFDLKEQQPKTMYRTVPAGSVYYFQLVNGTIEAVKELFHGKSISDQLSHEGYGVTFVGKI